MIHRSENVLNVKRPVMLLGLSVLLGCAGALLIGALFAMCMAAAAVIAAVIFALLKKQNIKTRGFAVAVLLTTAVSLLLFAGADREYRNLLDLQGKEVLVCGQVEQVEYTGIQRKYRIRGTLTADGESRDGVVSLTCNSSNDIYLFDHVTVTAELYEKKTDTAYDSRLIDSGEPVMNGYIRKIISAEQPQQNTLMMKVTRLRQNICDGLIRLLPDYRGNLLSEMTVGLSGIADKETQEAEELFKTAGISHILVVSGAHLMIVANVILLFLKLFGLNERLAAAISSVFILFYVFLAGAGVGVVRAGVMTLFVFAAKLLGRRSDSLTAISAAAAFIVAVKPLSLLSASMWLSFSASLGIILFSGRMTKVIVKKLAFLPAQRVISTVVESFCVSFAAWAATLPVMLLMFNGFSLYAVVVNMLIAPLLPVMMVLGMAAGLLSLISPGFFITRLCGKIAGAIIAVIKWIAEGVSQIPFANVEAGYDFLKIWMVGTVLLVLLVLLLVPGKKGRHLLRCCAVSVFALVFSVGTYALTMQNTAEISVSSLYEGSAVTVAYKGARVVLADVSKSGDVALLRSHIKAQNSSSVDLFIVETGDAANVVQLTEKALSAVDPAAVVADSNLMREEQITKTLTERETEAYAAEQEMSVTINGGEITVRMPADGMWLISLAETTLLYVTEDWDVLDMKAADTDVDVIILGKAELANAALLRNKLTVSIGYYANYDGYAETEILENEERLEWMAENGNIFSLKRR